MTRRHKDRSGTRRTTPHLGGYSVPRYSVKCLPVVRRLVISRAISTHGPDFRS